MGDGLLLNLLLIFNKYKNILLMNFIYIYRHKRLPFLYSLCMSLCLANTSANQNAAIVSFSLKDNYDMMIIFGFFAFSVARNINFTVRPQNFEFYVDFVMFWFFSMMQ